MNVDPSFVSNASLLCEPARATMLWNMLDGKAYTASELSLVADTSLTATSNHLKKLLNAGLIKVDTQGRHRYFSFANTEIAYAVEALASLTRPNKSTDEEKEFDNPIQYCRTCYDHLAGYVGVQFTEALEKNRILQKEVNGYRVSASGWKWLANLGLSKDELTSPRRPLTRQCLDWSERRPHLAGHLGAALLTFMLKDHWFRKVSRSRELILTSKGRQQLFNLLKVEL